MVQKRILISEGISGAGIEKLKEVCEVTTHLDLWKNPFHMEEMIAGCGALIIRNQTRVTGSFIEKAKDLCVIGRAGAGYDDIEGWQDCWCCSGCPGERTPAS